MIGTIQNDECACCVRLYFRHAAFFVVVFWYCRGQELLISKRLLEFSRLGSIADADPSCGL
jgi:hypothetical protein